jgi:hypothetical protein
VDCLRASHRASGRLTGVTAAGLAGEARLFIDVSTNGEIVLVMTG